MLKVDGTDDNRGSEDTITVSGNGRLKDLLALLSTVVIGDTLSVKGGSASLVY